jgi:hypothetical protein
MSITHRWRRLALAVLAGCGIAVVTLAAPVAIGGATPAYAQVSAEFQSALEPYGEWRRHPRWGEVWVPDDRPRGWRPYTYGHWVYTDEWGWYWVSDDEEADWGWVTYHYGRWVHDRLMGWFWIPGDEWAPAWVDWRRGDDYLGWAPLPPDDVIVEYEDDPLYWIFVQPRYMLAPRVRTYMLPPQRTVVVMRRTVVVNRTLRVHHDRTRTRIAVNPGIAPNIVAAAARRPVPTFRVQPRVIAGTQGVIGAVPVRPQDLSRRGQARARGPSPLQATIQRTTTVVQPVPSVPKAQPLGKNERGRLGSHPPRAAQGATPQQQQQQQAPAQKQTPALQPPAVTQPKQAPPQAKPVRPIAPQTPRSPAPSGQRSPAPPATRAAPPPHPIPPAIKPATPPRAPAVHRPAPPAAHAPARPAVRAAPPPKPPAQKKPDDKKPDDKK